MIKVLRFRFLFLVFISTTFSSVGQDILHLRTGGEKRIIFDSEDANSLTYRDYDDPDFKQVTEKKKLYSKVVLANGKTVWLTQRDNYFRCRLGMGVGLVSPLGDFASKDVNNENAGYALSGMQLSATLDVNIYKFVGLRAMVFRSGSIGDIDSWYDEGFAVGPEFHIKLSPRFYATIPVLFQSKKMGTDNYSSSNSYNVTGEGNGMGFITGLGMHARLGQHMAVGLNTQYFQQNMHMNFVQETYYNVQNQTQTSFDGQVIISYAADYKWSYLSTAATFTIHF